MASRGDAGTGRHSLDPVTAAREVLKELAAKGDPVKAQGAQRYFKEEVKSYGVAAPDVHALARALYDRIKADWTVEEAMALCDILFEEPELEPKAVGSLVLGRFKASFPPSLFARAKNWLAADRLPGWASVDVFAPGCLGAFLERYPAYVGKIKTWAGHSNRWVRRASLVSFIKLARKAEFQPAIYEISASIFGDEDDLIQKANCWLLREAGKADPVRLESFLRRHGPAIPRTTLRYAIERFPPEKRQELLRDTKKLT
ncbi:MAG TPA: DNA alkylation repair protein [Candidatus Aminicenantes bacterium]|nr:DNA alkylation repair protein [Candidatus Aminicenantes bacterium]HRY66213.1 DNA alkylation repair protein [Candidatus Aminicenantes bacterium]HRZ73127.1 DNA alkylation repair protein [Candidatus Aminicenantes bacterium]